MRTAATLIAALLAGCATPERAPERPLPGEPTLRVLSYNVNFGIAGDPSTIAAIRAANADLVLLQETTPAWERALRAAFEADYPHMAFRESSGAGGMAALSRRPLTPHEWLPSPAGWFPAWRVVAETALGPVQVLALHLHPPVSDDGSYISGYFTTGETRREEVDAYLPALEPGLPTLIVGDLNEEEDGEACERLEAAGFRSALPAFAPDQPTWRWQTSLGQLTFRLDHVLHDRALAPLDAHVLDAGRSDHLPLVVTLRRAP
jgi:endonuclease/exonuclease/phosphatase (EEP) superfamily protein YafD